MSDLTPNTLQQQVERLLEHCRHLQLENTRLQASEQNLKQERNRLLQVRDSTQKKLEAMIDRLKAMEQ